jgi:hypothetical protein
MTDAAVTRLEAALETGIQFTTRRSQRAGSDPLVAGPARPGSARRGGRRAGRSAARSQELRKVVSGEVQRQLGVLGLATRTTSRWSAGEAAEATKSAEEAEDRATARRRPPRRRPPESHPRRRRPRRHGPQGAAKAAQGADRALSAVRRLDVDSWRAPSRTTTVDVIVAGRVCVSGAGDHHSARWRGRGDRVTPEPGPISSRGSGTKLEGALGIRIDAGRRASMSARRPAASPTVSLRRGRDVMPDGPGQLAGCATARVRWSATCQELPEAVDHPPICVSRTSPSSRSNGRAQPLHAHDHCRLRAVGEAAVRGKCARIGKGGIVRIRSFTRGAP